MSAGPLDAVPLDPAWLARHPLPDHPDDTDKNGRGHVLCVGGSALVPGGLMLTGTAALRVGAGKLRLATIADAAVAIGVTMPEAGIVALPSREGEIAEGAAALLAGKLARADALVIGPGMVEAEGASALAAALIADAKEQICVIDAAAVAGAGAHATTFRAHGRLILTPHHGEAARLLDCHEDHIAERPERWACDAAARFDAVVVLKSARTFVAAPDGTLLCYAGGGIGLATGGSGDVLAGAIGGLAARGCDPLAAAAWGVWLHGEAGARLAERNGPIGLLARELPAEFPALMRRI